MSKKFYLLRAALMLTIFTSGGIDVMAQCAIPLTVSGTATSCSTANANWTLATGAAGYEYYFGTSVPSGAGTATAGTGVSLTGLAPSTTYFLYVRSDCGGGSYSAWTSPFTILTPACPSCPAPIVTGGAVACDSVIFSTSSTPANYEYVVDTFSSDPTGPGTPATAGLTGIGGLNGGTPYYIHVRQDCGGGSFSAWTTMTTPTNPCTPCAPPTLMVTPISCDSVWLQWAGTAPYEYAVDMSPVGPASGTITSATSVTVGGLSPTTVYYVHLRSTCGSGVSMWVNTVFTSLPCSSCMPPAGIITTPDANSVQLNWIAVPGASGYEYVVNTTAADPAGAGTVATGNSATVTGLLPNTSYFVHTRSTCAAGTHSPWSAPQAFQTPHPTGVGSVSTGQPGLLKAFPNPASTTVTLEYTGDINAGTEAQVLNIHGAVIKTITIAAPVTNVDIADFSSGIYFLKLGNNTLKITKL